MIKKASLFFFLLSFFVRLLAQTGPAGVGTSANNVLWLKADAGTSSTTNSTAISSWSDQSGNGINVTQTVSAQQPSFATNIMNGFPAIQFDNTNGAGSNDKFLGPDSPLLDNTSGYSFFMVTRPQNADNNARVVVSKRTGVAIDQSFMQFFFTGSTFYTDIQTNNDRYNTASSFLANNNHLIDQFFDGTLATAQRCKTYIAGNLDVTSSESNTLVPDNSSPLVVGSTDASDPRPFGGYMSEIIIYRTALFDASRIIVDNYLSAKYAIALSANDKYIGDNVGNGDYDREVAGIGQEFSGTNSSFSASISGGLTLSANSGLDNGDYLLAGHAVATNTTITADVGGITGTNLARWQRIWYVDITNTSANINANIEFDMSDGGMGTFTLGIVADYVLLYRAAQTGNWTEITSATAITGDRVQFDNLTLTNDGYYTLGTRNYFTSPLPITLISFEAIAKKDFVSLTWITASEKNNAYFTIERSQTGENFEAIAKINGAGTSSRNNAYDYRDAQPFTGLSYYRLKQTDYNQQSSYSENVVVEINASDERFTIFPNPNNGFFKLKIPDSFVKEILVTLSNTNGVTIVEDLKVTKNAEGLFEFNKADLSSGTFIITATFAQKKLSRKITIE